MKTIDLIPFETFECAENPDRPEEVRRFAQEKIKKRIIKKGKGYRLHNLIYNIQKLDEPNIITNQDIGLVYSSLVLSLPKDSYLSSIKTELPGAIERSFKGRFEELTRAGFYRLYQHLHVGQHEFQDLADIYQERLFERLNIVNGKSGTIEGEVLRLMDNEGFMDDNLLGLIGGALKEGSNDYFNQFRELQNEPRFKEYNSILERIEAITK
jgi:hypothetical protein